LVKAVSGEQLSPSRGSYEKPFSLALPVNINNPILNNTSANSNRSRKGRISVSLESFVEELLEGNQDELEKIAELQRILDQLLPPEQTQISIVSVTNNW
jgi:hypothetical protein